VNTVIITEITNRPETPPGRDIVQDFYEFEQVDPASSDTWEPIPDDQLSELEVPGQDTIPYAAWKVTTTCGRWMVYNWYEAYATGTNDDLWLYDRIADKEK